MMLGEVSCLDPPDSASRFWALTPQFPIGISVCGEGLAGPPWESVPQASCGWETVPPGRVRGHRGEPPGVLLLLREQLQQRSPTFPRRAAQKVRA